MKRLKKTLQLILFFLPVALLAQEIELFQQFNGHYDYYAFGNTLNLTENTVPGNPPPCEILTESSADFQLEPGQSIVAAYLYWAGVGDGDFEVSLNGNQIMAERTFGITVNTRNYFSAFADITTIVSAIGYGTYTLSELDLTDIIQNYCSNTTNFGGWAVNIIYEDPNAPINQVNLFDGFESVSTGNPEITITLENLNVLDNIGAKIGFLAWEGDLSIAVTETLQVNGNIISNPPLNPEDNTFNGTNSFTNSSVLYNMDMDFYNIENNINPGDTSADITLTSGQDTVFVNTIFTVLNTELPDATIVIDTISGEVFCDNRDFELEYTVSNTNASAVLPANTSIAFYANSSLIEQTATTMALPINGSESGTISITIPPNIPSNFNLRAVADDDGFGNGAVNELREDNNEFSETLHLLLYPVVTGIQNLELCDVLGIEAFDLTESTAQIDPINGISFHLSEEDAESNINALAIPEAYINTSNPQLIWIRVANEDCFQTDSFQIEVIPCPLPDATITIENDLFACRNRSLTVNYIVSNNFATGPLPAETPIAFYISGNLVAQSETQEIIEINGSEPGTIEVILGEFLPNNFTIIAFVDDIGTGIGVILELNDINNSFAISVEFGTVPPIVPLPNLLYCDQGNDTAIFDLTDNEPLISTNPNEVSFFINLGDAMENVNSISDPTLYQNTSDPQTIYVRFENEVCFTTSSFLITTENCKPEISQGTSPNNDGWNDVFKIKGLIDVYKDFELRIYTRQGNLIYEGGNEEGLWSSIPNTGLLYKDSLVPVGTYFYVLFLNDTKFPKPFTGFVYVNY
jgi:gliding motility-associated-like protein